MFSRGKMPLLLVGFGRCTHWTSKIGIIGACWNIGESPMLMLFKKIGFADPATGGSGALRRPQNDGGERPPKVSCILGPHQSRPLTPS